MNKLVGVFLLGAAVSLTACGGDSDSSGSSNNVTPRDFLGVPNCAIAGNSIVVKEFGQGCLVKKSNLNKGKTFKLTCSNVPVKGSYIITTVGNGNDAESVKKDIESISGNKYLYTCQGLTRG